MKINILAGPSFPIPTIIGGAVQKRWLIIAEAFAQKGHDVVLYSRAYDNFKKEERINGVLHVRFGGFDQSSNVYIDLFKDFFYALKLISRIRPAEITITNDFWLPFFTQNKKKLGHTFVNVGRFPKKQFFLYKHVSGVISISKAVNSEVIAQAPFLKDSCYIVNNPLNDRYLEDRLSERDKIHGRILYVGRLSKEKGVDMLISAFKAIHVKNQTTSLQIVGPWREEQGGSGKEYYDSLVNLARGFPILIDDPIFDMDRLVETYASAQVFCYPSLADKGEAFGIAPLEAMSQGTVTVVSSLECFQDFLKHEENGYVFDHRSEHAEQKLAKVLNTALKESEKNRIISINAKKTAQNFCVNDISNDYLKVFETVLEKKNEK